MRRFPEAWWWVVGAVVASCSGAPGADAGLVDAGVSDAGVSDAGQFPLAGKWALAEGYDLDCPQQREYLSDGTVMGASAKTTVTYLPGQLIESSGEVPASTVTHTWNAWLDGDRLFWNAYIALAPTNTILATWKTTRSEQADNHTGVPAGQTVTDTITFADGGTYERKHEQLALVRFETGSWSRGDGGDASREPYLLVPATVREEGLGKTCDPCTVDPTPYGRVLIDHRWLLGCVLHRKA